MQDTEAYSLWTTLGDCMASHLTFGWQMHLPLFLCLFKMAWYFTRSFSCLYMQYNSLKKLSSTVCSWHLCQILGTHSDGFVSGCSVLFHWSVSVHTSAPFWIDCWWRSPSLTSSILFIVLKIAWLLRSVEILEDLNLFVTWEVLTNKFFPSMNTEHFSAWNLFVSDNVLYLSVCI